MDADRFKRVEEIFRRALEVPAGERDAFLALACTGDEPLRRDVAELLATDAEDGRTLAQPIAGAMQELGALEQAAAELHPTAPVRIGSYRILRQLGEGGFGVVYLAEQENPRRTVALKVLRAMIATPEIVKRFEYEAQILGRLQDPGIAQIFEAGVAEERGVRQAFFAMEYVNGRNIIAYANASDRPGGMLTIAHRLELFSRVCDAIQHAHQKGVIHRDLKPDNILIHEEGRPDAGSDSGAARVAPTPNSGNVPTSSSANPVAVPNPALAPNPPRAGKAIEAASSASTPVQGPRPAHHSPSSTILPTSRRSSIHDGTSALSRSSLPQPKILDFGVARLTTREEQLTIVQTGVGQIVGTLSYMSPEQLSGDSNRIDTRSDVYSAGVVLYQLLTGSLPFDVRGRPVHEVIQIVRDRERTPISAHNRALRGDVEAIVHKALEKDVSRRYQSAAELAEDIRRYLRGEPILAKRDSALYIVRKQLERYRVAVYVGAAFFVIVMLASIALGISYYRQSALLVQVRQEQETAQQRMNEAQKAREAETEALRISERESARAQLVSNFLREMLATASPESASGTSRTVREMIDAAALRLDSGIMSAEPESESALRATLSDIYRDLGLLAESERHGMTALDLAQGVHPEPRFETAVIMRSLGLTLYRRGKHERAVEMLRDAVAMHRDLSDGPNIELADAVQTLAMALRATPQHDQAEALYREALTIINTARVDQSPVEAAVRNNLAAIALEHGDFDESERQYRVALDITRAVYGEDKPIYASQLSNLAAVYRARRDLPAAIRVNEEAQRIRVAALPPDHPEIANGINNLATLLFEAGELDRAEPLFEQALDIGRRALGEAHPDVIGTLANLAGIRFARGDLVAAEQLFTRCLDASTREFGPRHPRLISYYSNLGFIYQAMTDSKRAAEFQEAALSLQREHYPDNAAELIGHLQLLGDIYVSAQRPADAEMLLREALALFEVERNVQTWRRGTVHATLGVCLCDQRKFDEAEPLLIRSIDELADAPPHIQTRRVLACDRLAKLHALSNRPDESRKWLDEGRRIQEALNSRESAASRPSSAESGVSDTERHN